MQLLKEFKVHQNIEKIFIVLTLIFGFLYVFILPPFQSVDEGNHFFRTYQIADGNFVSKNISNEIDTSNNQYIGDYIPLSLFEYYTNYEPFIKNIDKKQNFENIIRDFKTNIDSEEKKFVSLLNTSLYSPVCYLSQLPGVILAKSFTNNLAIVYYFGRLSNLLIYCLLIFWALRIIPFYKLPLMLLALCPMSLSLAGAYTSDVMVFGLNFLWIAYILKFIVSKERDFVKIFILSTLAFLITISKSYILLLPLYFLIPVNNYKNKRNYFISMFCVIFSVILSGFIWYSLSKGLTLNMNNAVSDSSSQIEFIKLHPINYIWILLKTFIVKTPRLLITMIGVLGWQDTKLDWSTYILYPVMVYFAIFSDNFKFEFLKWQKYLILITIITGIVLTYTSLYIMWSPVANPLILGLNGKYFIPLMMPLFLLFKKSQPKYDYTITLKYVSPVVILILFTSELSLLYRFYNLTPQLYYKV